jgi:beta-lactamase regulating signal transducer with metallopeptidase domain
MSDSWLHLLTTFALQHVWQSTSLLIMVWLATKSQPRFSARMQSRIWLCAFLLALILPFAVLLPRATDVTSTVVKVAPSSTVLTHAPLLHGPLIHPKPHDVGSGRAPPTARTLLTDVEMALVGMWLLGMLGGVWRLLSRWGTTRKLYQASSPPTDLVPHQLPRGTCVRISEDISSPIVVGLIRPCVLLPRDLIDHASEETLTHVMDHEIAHVRRGDLWIAWVQAIGLAAYWWNPVLRMIGARLDITREMACDEQAIMQSGTPISYANALLTSTRSALLCPTHSHTLAVGIFETPAALTRRVEALLGVEIGKSIDSRKVIALVSLGMILASTSLTLLATPRLGPARSVDFTTKAPSVNSNAAALIDDVVDKQPDAIRTLVRRGADVNVRQTGDGTALIIAAGHGEAGIVRELINLGANVNEASPGDGTPLIAAAKRGDATEVRELVDSGASVNEASMGDGNPLIAASAHGHLDVAELLVAKGADVNAIVEGDETPLINAARFGNLALVKSLVEQGADVNLGVLANGYAWRSPLNQASNAKIRRYLRSKGATPRQQ